MKRFGILLMAPFLVIVIMKGHLHADMIISGKIRIAVMDFTPKGGYTKMKDRIELLSDIIRSEISRSLHFDVVERDELKKLLQGRELELAGLGNESDIVKIGKLISVKQIILGTIGELYGKVVVTLRLVNAETGKIIYASTVYSSEDQVVYDIKNIISDLNNMALVFATDVTREDIRKSIKDKNYRKAWFQINKYSEKKDADGGEDLFKMKEEVTVNLSKQYYNEADDALDKGYFSEARTRINLAIALQNRESYLKLRDRINKEEEEYKYRVELEKKQRMKEIERYGEEYQPFSQKAREYFHGLSYNGILLAASTGVNFKDNNKVNEVKSWWGFDILGIDRFFSHGDSYVGTSPTAYMGFNFRYEKGENGYYQFVFNPYLTPFLSFGIKLLNLNINIGADGGFILRSSKMYSNEKIMGVTVGAMGLVQFKLWKSTGVFAGCKFDREWYRSLPEYSSYQGRILAGLVF